MNYCVCFCRPVFGRVLGNEALCLLVHNCDINAYDVHSCPSVERKNSSVMLFSQLRRKPTHLHVKQAVVIKLSSFRENLSDQRRRSIDDVQVKIFYCKQCLEISKITN